MGFHKHGFLILDDEIDTFSCKVVKELLLYSAQYHMRALISYTSMRTPEIANGYEPSV